jgi:hypothetical protein
MRMFHLALAQPGQLPASFAQMNEQLVA